MVPNPHSDGNPQTLFQGHIRRLVRNRVSLAVHQARLNFGSHRRRQEKGYDYIFKKYAPQKWHTFTKWFVPLGSSLAFSYSFLYRK
jgi:hypothetical protein